MKYKRVVFFYIIFFTGTALAFGFGYLTRLLQDKAEPTDLLLLEEAYSILENHAYKELPGEPILEYGMIRGMVEAYDDPYTSFVEPAQHELYSDQLAGRYGGIGSSLEYDLDGYIVLHPFKDSPASEVGILDGDRLVKVDDWEIIPNVPIDEVVAAIRGPEGERVTISIARPPDFATLSFDIKRKDIPLPSVTWHLYVGDQRLGVIQVNVIAESTPEEIQEAVNDLGSRGATHYALDLRGNRGGLLDAGIKIARIFLESGTVIQEHYRDQEIETHKVEKPGPLAQIPMVVLVNSDTASAAEIVAGAIKIHERAPIIGSHTFGKDTIQLVFSLEDGSSLHVTAAKWWVKGLEPPIGENGIEPDIQVPDDGADGDPFLEAALQTLFNSP